MTPERWRKVEEIFHAALDLPPDERTTWLDTACAGDGELKAEVQSLLASDGDNTAGLENPVPQAVVALHEAKAPRRAGPYELLERIGHGGMGTVYRARRADDAYQTTVAIKLVRMGMDTEFILARFKRERQTLAKLTHPNIARLLDGGTTEDDTPYIVMEFIEGSWITDYCQGKQLSVPERLRLFLQVCSAVDYAHRNFVVHRDIKPGNILVDQTGVPKLLDFGICKLIHANPMEAERTLTEGIGLLTPDYASPEQVLGEAISPRSDVYSLGAVLYELLTGQRAHRVEKYTPVGLEEAICRADTVAPSAAARELTLRRQLEGDLDNILLRALQKDPDRRYDSVAAFAQDIERHLQDLPVTARPDTRTYRARKFVKRHQGLVAAVSGIVLALGIGLGFSVMQARRATFRETQTRGIAKSLLFDVYDSVHDVPGTTKARQTIVDTGLKYLDALAGTNPSEPDMLLELSVGYCRMAEVLGNNNQSSNLGKLSEALAAHRKAVHFSDLYMAAGPRQAAVIFRHAQVLREMADVEAIVEGPKKAVETYRSALAWVQEVHRLSASTKIQPVEIDILTALGRQERELGEFEASLRDTTRALQIAEMLAATNPSEGLLSAVASSASAVGMTEARMNQLKPALSHYQRAVEIRERLVQQSPASVSARRNLMIAYSHVGDVAVYPGLPNLGDAVTAKKAYAKMVAIAQGLVEADPSDARAKSDLLNAAARAAISIPFDDAEKAPALREALGLLEVALRQSGESLSVRAYAVLLHTQMGLMQRNRGDLPASAMELAKAVDSGSGVLDRANAAFRVSYLRALGEQAITAARRGLAADARRFSDRAIELAGAPPKQVGGSRVALPRAYTARALVEAALGDTGQARTWRDKALAEWVKFESKEPLTDLSRREKSELEKIR